MNLYLKWGLVAVALLLVAEGTTRYWSWEEDRMEAALVARAMKYAVQQFAPAYHEFVQTNLDRPRDNMDLGLPPPRDSLWVGLTRAELYANGDVHFEFAAADERRRPLLVWRINASSLTGVPLPVCGARDIGRRVLAWNGLQCDSDVAEPAENARNATPTAARKPVTIIRDAVLEAVREDNVARLERLRRDGQDICATADNQLTPLAEAVRGNQSKVLALLLTACEIDQVEPFSGQTPLMIASAAREIETVRALLMAGASPVARSSRSDSAWFLVGTDNDTSSQQIRLMLHVKGAAMDTRAADQSTLLMRAAASGNRGLVEWLARSGATIDLQDRRGRSALMYAALSPHGEATLEFLISERARLDLTDEAGKTALALAQAAAYDESRKARITSILWTAGARN